MIVTSKCNIKNIIKIHETLKMFEFNIEKYIPWEPGMFFYMNIKNDIFNSDWSNSRPFSFASYGNKTAKVLIRKKEYYTVKIFNDLKINDDFYIKYSFGNFFLNDLDNKVVIAGGAGISPFLSLFDWLKSKNIDSKNYIFHSVRNESELLENFYEDLPQNVVLHNFVTQEASKKAQNKRIEISDILNSLEDKNNYSYYICGNNEFNNYYSNELIKNGIKNIYYENWN